MRSILLIRSYGGRQGPVGFGSAHITKRSGISFQRRADWRSFQKGIMNNFHSWVKLKTSTVCPSWKYERAPRFTTSIKVQWNIKYSDAHQIDWTSFWLGSWSSICQYFTKQLVFIYLLQMMWTASTIYTKKIKGIKIWWWDYRDAAQVSLLSRVTRRFP